MVNLKPKIGNSKPNSGFTVIELLVSTGIMALILGMIFASYPRFRARTSLAAMAREVGLLVREAQVFGLAVKEFPANQEEFPPYGIHINALNLREIILFGDLADGARAGVYDSGQGCGSPDTECIRRFTLAGPEFIEKICVIPGGGGKGGPPPEEFCDIGELNITFRRPEPEAVIVTEDLASRYNAAKIYLKSSKETAETRTVRIWITGQISIQ